MLGRRPAHHSDGVEARLDQHIWDPDCLIFSSDFKISQLRWFSGKIQASHPSKMARITPGACLGPGFDSRSWHAFIRSSFDPIVNFLEYDFFLVWFVGFCLVTLRMKADIM